MNTVNTIWTCLLYMIGIVGLLFNALLIWLIKTKSSNDMSNFKWFLMNYAICDFVLSICLANVQARAIFIDSTSAVLVIFGKV